MNDKKSSVGVIVGRFQVPYLHSAHIELIDSVVKNHPKVIIFLGLSPCLVTTNNPLDFEARKKMIQDKYPESTILYIKDVPSDEVWSKKLDEQISDIITPNQTVTLYGSRDSFICHYKGKFKTTELESTQFISGTEIRNSISKSVKQSPDFRSGVIWAAYNRYPTVYTTVDIAILKDNMVLLGRKPNETSYQFIGGFSSPESQCFEDDARREVLEETGLEVSYPEYIGSAFIDDWRYKNEKDKIKTLFFKANYTFGPLVAGDDISEVKWFDINDLDKCNIIPAHHVLRSMLKKNLQKT